MHDMDNDPLHIMWHIDGVWILELGIESPSFVSLSNMSTLLSFLKLDKLLGNLKLMKIGVTFTFKKIFYFFSLDFTMNLLHFPSHKKDFANFKSSVLFIYFFLI